MESVLCLGVLRLGRLCLGGLCLGGLCLGSCSVIHSYPFNALRPSWVPAEQQFLGALASGLPGAFSRHRMLVEG